MRSASLIEISEAKFDLTSAQRIGEGAGSQVYLVTRPGSTEQAVLKVFRDCIGPLSADGSGEAITQAAKQEVYALKRLYPEAHIALIKVEEKIKINSGESEEIVQHLAIVMPRFPGQPLQPENGLVHPGLKTLNFPDRVKLALQLVNGYKLLNYPTSPEDLAIINPDIHGGNIMVDVQNKRLYLFDFDKCMFLEPGQREIELGRKVCENYIGMPPEAVNFKKISKQSDSYRLVAQELLLFGALDSGKLKLDPRPGVTKSEKFKEEFGEPLEGKGDLEQKVYESNIKKGFDYTGFLMQPDEKGNLKPMEGIPGPPDFPVSVGDLLRQFYKRRDERDPNKRASTLEGARFLEIVDKVCSRESKAIISIDDYIHSVELILLSMGLWNENQMFIWKLADCTKIMDAYHLYTNEPNAKGSLDRFIDVLQEILSIDQLVFHGKMLLQKEQKAEAIKWFKVAAYRGSEEAERQLDRMVSPELSEIKRSPPSTEATSFPELQAKSQQIPSHTRDNLRLIDSLQQYKKNRIMKGYLEQITYYGSAYRWFKNNVLNVFTQRQKTDAVDKLIGCILNAELGGKPLTANDFVDLHYNDFLILRDGELGKIIKNHELWDRGFQAIFKNAESKAQQKAMMEVMDDFRLFPPG